MISQDDIKSKFDEHFWRKVYPLMVEKEKVRQKYVADLKKLVAISLFVLPIVISLIVEFYKKYDQDWFINLIFFAVAINSYIIRGPFVRYKGQVKNDIMNRFISFFDGFEYTHGNGLSYYEFDNSYIFPQFDKFVTDDCFLGVYNDVNVRICEEHLTKRVKHSKGYKDVTVFMGIVLELDMNKSFSGHTFVIKDKGLLNKFSRFGGFERVSLEDVVFEKEFEAYSENQIEARYLLTTAFMERMLKLKELYKGKSIQFSFSDSKVLIAINTNENMFEPCSLLKSNLQEKQVYTVFDQFMTIFSVIDILKLNQKTGL